ncbi:MFS transporter [Corynebacterium sp. 335C]
MLSRRELDQLDSMWKSPALIPALVTVVAAFGGWALLLPVIPQAILDGGGSAGLAGAYTGVFMAATVATQTQTPRMVRAWGYSTTMLISALFLALPTFGHLLGTGAALVLPLAVLRGMGFGALTVAQSALIAELVPVRFLGKASGTLGLAVGGAQLVLLPLGLMMAKVLGGYAWVYILGALISLTGAVMCAFLPRFKAPPKVTTSGSRTPGDDVPAWKLIAVPAIGISTVSMGFGGISTFLAPGARETDPVAGAVVAAFALSVVGGAQMISRYVAGWWADRVGRAGTLLAWALGAAALGLGLMAFVMFVGGGGSSYWLLAAAGLYGGGFGIIQNEALLLMFERLPRERNAEASAYWNMSYDAGTGVGSFALGLVAGAAAQSYPAVFGTAALIAAFGMIVVAADWIAGRHRIAETHNTTARLRRLGSEVRVQARKVPGARPAYRGVRRAALAVDAAGDAAIAAGARAVRPLRRRGQGVPGAAPETDVDMRGVEAARRAAEERGDD